MTKRILCMLTTLAMVVGLVGALPVVTAGADTYGDYEYEILDDGTAEITRYTSDAKLLVIPSVINGYAVTSIGEYAFYSCYSLKTVTIPNSVTSIGDSAFYWCERLTSITIPDSVTIIGDNAFHSCISLESIILPKNLISIGAYAFADCDSSEFTVLSIPDSVTSIGDSAFSSCTYLRAITLPNSLITVGDYAFSDCECLTSITIPDNVSSIGKDAFSGCQNLRTITIPDSVIYIGAGAFNYCDYLTIICGKGSYAQQYAIERELAYVFFGEESTIPSDIHSYNAFLMYADNTWLWSNFNAQAGGEGYGIDAEITKDGTYTVAITSESVDKNENGYNQYGKGGTDYASGAVYFCVDIAGILCCEKFNASSEAKNGVTKNGIYSADDIACNLKSIKMDGQELKFDASKVLYGNIDDLNTNYKIEIYSMYGDTKGNPPINPASIKWSQSLEVTFDISGITSDSNFTDSTGSSNSTKPSSTDLSNKPAQPTTSPTAAPTTAKAPSTTAPKTTPTTPTKVTKPAKVTKLNATAKKKKLNVSWKKVSGATGYEVQIATNNKFTKNKKTVTVKKNNAVIKNLKAKKKYFVKVRAYKKANGKTYYGKWSKVVSKKTK